MKHVLAITTLLITLSISCSSSDKAPQGKYTHSFFESKSRGRVDFNVYLPPKWNKTDSNKYPLIILLHGQGQNENSFPNAILADDLNSWINQSKLTNLVIIALRGGENTKRMQWYSYANQIMITSNDKGELKYYCSTMFNTSMEGNMISLIGHSRGATGALYFGLNYSNNFSSIISSAYVSDYVLNMLIESANTHLNQIKKSEIRIKMLIGTEDQFALKLGRRGSYLLSDHLKSIGVKHDLVVMTDTRHNLSDIWEPDNSLNYLKFVSKLWGIKKDTTLNTY